MSVFTFNCPYCRQSLSAELDLVGTAIACPSCLKELVVPNLAISPPPLPTARKQRSLTFRVLQFTFLSLVLFVLYVIVSLGLSFLDYADELKPAAAEGHKAWAAQQDVLQRFATWSLSSNEIIAYARGFELGSAMVEAPNSPTDIYKHLESIGQPPSDEVKQSTEFQAARIGFDDGFRLGVVNNYILPQSGQPQAGVNFRTLFQPAVNSDQRVLFPPPQPNRDTATTGTVVPRTDFWKKPLPGPDYTPPGAPINGESATSYPNRDYLRGYEAGVAIAQANGHAKDFSTAAQEIGFEWPEELKSHERYKQVEHGYQHGLRDARIGRANQAWVAEYRRQINEQPR